MSKVMYQSGQTLVALLAFMAMAITITTTAAVVTIVNSQTSSKYTLGQEALRNAEAGADNAMLRLVRDPNYTGETITVGTGTAIITITGSNPKTIESEGINGIFRRKVRVITTLTNNVRTIDSWSEIP